MKYQGKHPSLPIIFSLGKTDYCVNPGETVSIDDKWHATIVARGLMLEIAVEPIVIEAPVETPPVIEIVDQPPVSSEEITVEPSPEKFRRGRR